LNKRRGVKQIRSIVHVANAGDQAIMDSATLRAP